MKNLGQLYNSAGAQQVFRSTDLDSPQKKKVYYTTTHIFTNYS